MYRHSGFWISFVADTNERRAIRQRKRIEVGIKRSDGIEFYRSERAVDDTERFGFIEYAGEGGDDTFGANLRHRKQSDVGKFEATLEGGKVYESDCIRRASR